MKLIPVFIIFILSRPVLGQEKNESSRKGVEASVTYTGQGFAGGPGFYLSKGGSTVVLGLRTSLTYLNRYSKVPSGIFINYRFGYRTEGRLKPFAEIFYGNVFMKIRTPFNNSPEFYQLHELYVGYGVSYTTGHFTIGNSIGFGGFAERQTDHYMQKPYTWKSSGSLIKLQIAYEF